MWLLFLVAFFVVVTVAVIISMRSAVEVKEEDEQGFDHYSEKTVGQRYIDLVMNHKRNDKKPVPQQKKLGKIPDR